MVTKEETDKQKLENINGKQINFLDTSSVQLERF